MRLFFAFFIATCSFQYSIANSCDELLASFERVRLCHYQPNYCQENIANLAYDLEFQISKDPLLKKSRVLFLYDQNFKKLTPETNLYNGEGWRWHVVLDTPYGLLDLEDLSVFEKQSLPSAQEYFSKYFHLETRPHEFAQIHVQTVPVENYIHEYKKNSVKKFLSLSAPPKGWVKTHVEKELGPNFELPINSAGFSQYFMAPGSPLYYVLSDEVRKKYDNMGATEYLKNHSLQSLPAGR